MTVFLALLGTLLAASPASAQQRSPAPTERRSDMFRDPFFVEVEGGATYMALLSVRGDRSAFPNMVSFTGWGPGAGVTLGFHALVFSVGVQVYYCHVTGEGDVLNPTSMGPTRATGEVDLVATTLEGAFRLPMGRVELSMRIAVGHAFMGRFSSDSWASAQSVNANGWTGRAGLGVDVRVWRKLFVGFDLDAAVTNVRRSGIAGGSCSGDGPVCAELERDGDAVALMVHPHLQLGLHF